MSGRIEVLMKKYFVYDGSVTYDGETVYEITYNAGRPVEMVRSYRDDIDPGPGVVGEYYCITEETIDFTYDDISGNAVAESNTLDTYYPSGTVENEVSIHELAYRIGADFYPIADSGSYIWPQEDDTPSRFAYDYDYDNYLKQSHNDDGEPGSWLTCDFTWKDGNLAKISQLNSYGESWLKYEYADSSLKNNIRGFDLNWLLIHNSETMDFAAGDITKIWAAFGFIGNRSKNLATCITESESGSDAIWTYRMTYKSHNKYQTEVRVEAYRNNVLDSYDEWVIKYSGAL